MIEEQPSARVYVVDDDADLGASLARLLRRLGYEAEPFLDPALLLESYEEGPASCVLTDVMMGEMDGFAFAERLRAIDPAASVVFMTAWPSTSSAVDAIRKYGGLDYLEKPIDQDRLAKVVAEGVAWSRSRRTSAERLARLTKREREVFALLVRGFSTKEVARELGLSPRTIEDHRAQISTKTNATSLRELVAIAECESPGLGLD